MELFNVLGLGTGTQRNHSTRFKKSHMPWRTTPRKITPRHSRIHEGTKSRQQPLNKNITACYSQEIDDECPQKCSCSMPKVVIEPETEFLEPIISVDCSYKGFTVFPETLPTKTKTLYLQGNDIGNITPLRTNPLYENILDIYLDYNKITSIEELEGSVWLKHFRVLSLRGNKLSQVPSNCFIIWTFFILLDIFRYLLTQ